MSITDENKPNERAGQRRGKAKQRTPKPDQRQRPKSDRRPDDSALVEPAMASNETLPVEPGGLPDPAGIEPVTAPSEPRADRALVPVDPSPVAVAAPAETFWIGFQTIAHTYSACAWRSMEEAMGLVEKLTAARSIEESVDIQNQFTRQACGGFLEESQKIWRLHSELAVQLFRSFERFLVCRPPMAG